MKISSRIKAIILIICFAVLGVSSISFAGPVDDARNAAMEQLAPYKSALNGEREHYGLKASDDVQNVILGEGYNYYKISYPHLKEIKDNNVKPSPEKMFVQSEGYIFQMIVANKPTAILFVDKNENGKWVVNQMTNYASFQQDIDEAKEKIKQTYKNLHGDIRLIYDDYTSIRGLLFADGSEEYIIPMKKATFLDVDKHTVHKFSDISGKVVKLYKDRIASGEKIGGGSSDILGANYHLDLIIIAAGMLMVAGVLVIIFKRRGVRQG